MTTCVLCGKPAYTFIQQPLRPGGQARQYVTCSNRLCCLNGNTLEAQYVRTMTFRQAAAYRVARRVAV